MRTFGRWFVTASDLARLVPGPVTNRLARAWWFNLKLRDLDKQTFVIMFKFKLRRAALGQVVATNGHLHGKIVRHDNSDTARGLSAEP